MAPGSQVVTDYYEKAGLWPYLEKLGYNLVGYGCTTCIGNSGPLADEISAAVNESDLTVVSVLSGNRNFEGRINPDVKMNYLASPPLVIAYALAGTMDFDFDEQPLGTDTDGNDVYLKDIWPSPQEIQETIASSINKEMFASSYADVFDGGERWKSLPTPEGKTFEWDAGVDLRPQAPVLRRACRAEPSPVTDITGARVLAKLGDSVTTDHISPAGAIKAGTPAGAVPDRARHHAQGLQLLRVPARQPRGDDPRHVRQHPAAQRSCWTHVRPGRLHPRLHPAGCAAGVHLRRGAELRGAGIPLVVLGGKEYGSGSSRDWAAKGTALLGVRAVITESFERIHRSNLIGMGVIPLQFPEGETIKTLGLDGDETFDISGITELNDGPHPAHREGDRDQAGRRCRSSSTPWSGSTHPARRTTTATAASCSTCCAALLPAS